MTVANILKSKGSDVVTAKPADVLMIVSQTLAKRRIGAVVVLGADGAVAGVLSERDVVAAIAKHGVGALERPISEFMTDRVVTCSLSDSTEELLESMTRGRFRHLPVVEDGRLCGIVSIGDVVKRRIDDAEHEARTLREYIVHG